jgi:hypothetical protein
MAGKPSLGWDAQRCQGKGNRSGQECGSLKKPAARAVYFVLDRQGKNGFSEAFTQVVDSLS